MTDAADQPSETELLEGVWLVVSLGFTQGYKWVSAPILVANLATFLLIYPYAPLWASLAWLGLMSLVILTRRHIIAWISQDERRPIHDRIRLLLLLGLWLGLIRGASILFFPMLPDLHKAILSLILVSICTGAVTAVGGYWPLVVSIIAPILVPLSLMWMINPGPNGPAPSWFHVGIGLLMACTLSPTIGHARDCYAIFKESFILRFQQRGLAARAQLALAQAEMANLAKSRFLAAASHDLRQPLHSLSLFVMALEHRPLDPRSAGIVACIAQATDTLKRQLDSLLDISKLDAGVVAVAAQALELAPFLAQLGAESQQPAENKGLTLTWRCPDALLVKTDPVLLERLLRNLLDNAIKYTPAGGIQLAAHEEDGNVVISVSDTGIGIAPEEQERIFEEFYQVDNPERDRSKGLGLGLAIVRRLTTLLQLSMKLTSSLGQGSQFSLTLAMPAAPRVMRPLAARVICLDDFRGLSVLIIDDDATVRLGLHTLLSELGCAVHQADSSAAAAEVSRHARPDLILADVRLRGADTGMAAIRAVWQIWPQAPAALISGDTARASWIAAAELGIPLHHKPIAFDLLQGELARACRHKQGPG